MKKELEEERGKDQVENKSDTSKNSNDYYDEFSAFRPEWRKESLDGRRRLFTIHD